MPRRIDSIDKLKASLDKLRNELKDETKFRDIYNYAFSFAREVGPSNALLLLSSPMVCPNLLLVHAMVSLPAPETCIYLVRIALQKGQKCLQLDTAVGMWQLIFSSHPWPLVGDWCDFLQEHHNRSAAVLPSTPPTC